MSTGKFFKNILIALVKIIAFIVGFGLFAVMNYNLELFISTTYEQISGTTLPQEPVEIAFYVSISTLFVTILILYTFIRRILEGMRSRADKIRILFH